MKALTYIIIAAILVGIGCTKTVLDKTPQGVQTPEIFYEDSNQAILGINAIYDAASWEEGPNVGSNLEWMYGDVLSNDAEKGSTPGDFIQLQEMKEWRANPSTSPARIRITICTRLYLGLTLLSLIYRMLLGTLLTSKGY